MVKITKDKKTNAVTGVPLLPPWTWRLPLQQQGVLVLCLRGPDGVEKHHPCKVIVRNYRASIITCAKYGTMLYGEVQTGNEGEHIEVLKGDDFIEISTLLGAPKVTGKVWYNLQVKQSWRTAVDDYVNVIDCLPHHFNMHLMHGAQILGYKHPVLAIRNAWKYFYDEIVNSLHLINESEETMDKRLSDWNQAQWIMPKPVIAKY